MRGLRLHLYVWKKECAGLGEKEIGHETDPGWFLQSNLGFRRVKQELTPDFWGKNAK